LVNYDFSYTEPSSPLDDGYPRKRDSSLYLPLYPQFIAQSQGPQKALNKHLQNECTFCSKERHSWMVWEGPKNGNAIRDVAGDRLWHQVPLDNEMWLCDHIPGIPSTMPNTRMLRKYFWNWGCCQAYIMVHINQHYTSKSQSRYDPQGASKHCKRKGVLLSTEIS
jgi:hypothetical protein